MAQAADQHTPSIEWEDRWTLDRAFHYLTVTSGYTEQRALDEMEQVRLDRRLQIKVQKIVDGKPQGDPELLPFDKKHKLVRDLGRVVPQNHKWGDNRWTVYKQRVLELWSFPNAPDRLPEDKVGPAADRPSAEQSSQDEPKKEGPQVRRVKPVLKELFPPDGLPPVDMLQKTVWVRVNEYFEARGQKFVSLDTVARALGRHGA